MRKIFGLVFLIPVMLCGCVKKTDTSNLSSTSLISNSESMHTNYDYDDISEQIVYWDEIPLIDLNEFIVYFFSRTCGHCQSIKQQVIPIILSRSNIFACEASNEFVFCNIQPIGKLDEIDFCIIGYPTAVYFKNGSVILYANGEKEVLGLLNQNISL